MNFVKQNKIGLLSLFTLVFVTSQAGGNISYAQEPGPEPSKTETQEKKPEDLKSPSVSPSGEAKTGNKVKKTDSKINEKVKKNVPKTTEPKIKKTPGKVVKKAVSKSPYAFKPGKVYYKTHTVKARETLYIIARKYGMRYRTLAAMNNAKTPYLKIGQKVILSKSIEPVGSINGIVVNIPEKRLYYFTSGKLVRTYGVAVGQPNIKWQTPVGDFKIIYKVKDPVWKVPLSIQKEMKERGQEVKKEVPAGPANPLGKWWMGLTWTGLGIHSTTAPASIGYSVSHGCIRMVPKTAEELFNLVKTNTPVIVAYEPIKISMDGKHRVYLEVFDNIYNKKLDTVKKAKEMLIHYKLDKNIDWKKVTNVATRKTGKPEPISKT